LRILLDTNVLLDVALAREPFAVDSADVLRWAEAGGAAAAAVAWHSLTNCASLLKGGGRPFLERQAGLALRRRVAGRRAFLSNMWSS